jgi:16S rRNA (uracil1498-N3)-methyltransferase
MHVFFEPNLSQTEIVLPEDESKHCIKVLRLAANDKVLLTDGNGNIANAIVVHAHPKKCILQIVDKTFAPPMRKYNLHLLVAPAKSAERNEWLVEKATEAGADEITFIETMRTERTRINLDRLHKIAVSAIKQSKQWHLPKINPLVQFNQAICSVHPNSLKLIAKVGSNRQYSFYNLLQSKHTHIAVFIGPEGDFTNDEMAIAQQHQCKPLWLGHSVLRTETAALYACMAVKALLEN